MLEKIKKILNAEAEAIVSIPLDQESVKTVNEFIACKGKVFTTGIGKAGYVARKAASTFSTTGTPSVFLHPAESSHGDIGVISSDDILLAFSNSGKTREVIETIGFCRNLNIKKVISITAEKNCPVAEMSDIQLAIGKIIEPCPLGFTPSASTSAMIALSDALALVTMTERGFSKEDFAQRHHGGYLGVQSRK